MFRWLSEEICVIFANSLLGATIQDGGMSERSDVYGYGVWSPGFRLIMNSNKLLSGDLICVCAEGYH